MEEKFLFSSQKQPPTEMFVFLFKEQTSALCLNLTSLNILWKYLLVLCSYILHCYGFVNVSERTVTKNDFFVCVALNLNRYFLRGLEIQKNVLPYMLCIFCARFLNVCQLYTSVRPKLCLLHVLFSTLYQIN